MPATVIQSYSPAISVVDRETDAILAIVLAASRTEGGERLELTPSQKEMAMNAAKAALEIIPGTIVAASSTSFVLPTPTLNDGESLTLKIGAELEKNTPEIDEVPY